MEIEIRLKSRTEFQFQEAAKAEGREKMCKNNVWDPQGMGFAKGDPR